jgi:hypothetical protein
MTQLRHIWLLDYLPYDHVFEAVSMLKNNMTQLRHILLLQFGHCTTITYV